MITSVITILIWMDIWLHLNLEKLFSILMNLAF
jgi:hypothetical protein